MATQPTYDYEAEQSDLDRRQKLLEAMAQGSMGPIQTFQSGGQTGVISPFQVLDQLLKGYIAGKGQSKLKDDRAALSQRYSSDLAKGMEQFYRTSEGGAVPSMALQPDAQGNPRMVQQAPDKRKAILDLMASNHPVLREMGMKLISQKPEADPYAILPKDALAHFDPTSVAKNPRDPSTWAPKEDIRTLGERFWKVGKGGVENIGGVEYSDPLRMAGVGLVQGSNATGKLDVIDKTPKTTVSVNASPVLGGQKAGMEAYFKSAANKVEALGNLATTAQDNLNSLAELKNLDAKGIFSNVTSGPATFLSNLAQAAGMQVDTAKLANTENYNAITTDLWQGLVAKYGGNRGVTKDEALEIKKLLPLATNSPQARQQLFTVLENVGARQIAQYQSANDAFARASLAEDPTIFSKEFGNVFTPQPSRTQPALPPAGAAAGTGQPISLDDYLRKQLGGK